MLGIEYLKTLGYVEVIRIDEKGKELFSGRFPLGYHFHCHRYYTELCDIYRFINNSGIAEFGSDIGFVKFYTKSDISYNAVYKLLSKMKEAMEKDRKKETNIQKLS